MKDVLKKCEKVKIDPWYDLTYMNIIELYNMYNDDPFALISNSFRLGYMQGAKAEKKKMADRV